MLETKGRLPPRGQMWHACETRWSHKGSEIAQGSRDPVKPGQIIDLGWRREIHQAKMRKSTVINFFFLQLHRYHSFEWCQRLCSKLKSFAVLCYSCKLFYYDCYKDFFMIDLLMKSTLLEKRSENNHLHAHLYLGISLGFHTKFYFYSKSFNSAPFYNYCVHPLILC